MKYLLLKLILLLCSVTLFISCKKENTKVYIEIAAESKKLNDFFQMSFERKLDNSPQFQTLLGIKKDYGELDDISPSADERKLMIKKEELQWLNDSINTNALSKDALLNYKLFKQNIENNISDYKYRLYNYPVNQMYGAQSWLPSVLISMHQIDNIKDAEDYISRLNGFNKYFTQLVENLKEREAIGVMPPKFVYDKVIQDSENILIGQPFDKSNKESTLLKDFMKKVNNLDADDKIKFNLEKQAREALLTSVKSAYEKLISFTKEQKTRANNDHGVWKFPDGEAFYNNALNRTTTTNLTADEIHNIGLAEVDRIHEEMNVIREKVGFKGSLKEFFQFIKTDKQFYYTEDQKGKDAYLKESSNLIDSMKARLDDFFITKPKADIIVKAVEPFREKSAGKAFYYPPTEDGSRPGIYYVNLYDMKSMPTYQMEALAYHEGLPGHHMQLSLQKELENVPMFRRHIKYISYVEGWGLYSEYLPKEMGFYADPYSDFGRLEWELFRACRLVVDTGIHAKKWTREDGIKYYMDNTPNPELDIIRMVERHIVMPSQATAYKIGMMKILELRKKAKNTLGDKFDIREFHEVVLSNGSIPLNVLENFVDEYINSY
ncbi:DUF885 domain-containing protein [Aestuariivivens insulae]|uniref:DUF885 domain-containing protein n=1 Tax=Aestuariivivens insulae TaxID=1621988 RepID=UPI001F57A559|nr:DUF885 domain-containing protein [Aestuariivivens insulae]